jgi:glycerophosphoryl diester phosphodiesterase
MLFESVPTDWREQLHALGAVTLHCSATCLDPLRLAEARAASIPVLCYTVNRPEEAKKLLAAGVSGMFTDALDFFVDETTAYNPLHFPG